VRNQETISGLGAETARDTQSYMARETYTTLPIDWRLLITTEHNSLEYRRQADGVISCLGMVDAHVQILDMVKAGCLVSGKTHVYIGHHHTKEVRKTHI
jgi:hypothetical protein